MYILIKIIRVIESSVEQILLLLNFVIDRDVGFRLSVDVTVTLYKVVLYFLLLKGSTSCNQKVYILTSVHISVQVFKRFPFYD